MHLPPRTVALLSPMGYGAEVHSVESLVWMFWFRLNAGFETLRTARAGGEVRLGARIQPDGVGVSELGGGRKQATVLFYHGCHW